MIINKISKEETQLYKGIGILLIVFHNFFHWLPPYIGENEFWFSPDVVRNFYSALINEPLQSVNSLFSFLGHYGVQIFIFISGVGLAISMQNRHRSWGNFMLERLKKLYPLLLVGIIFYFFNITLIAARLLNADEWKEILYKLLFIHTLIPGKGLSLNGPWWFFGLIFQLYLLFPLIFKLIKKYKVKAFAGICLVCYGCTYIFLYFLPDSISETYMQNAIAHLPEFAFGILIILYVNKEIRLPWIILAGVIFVLGNFYKPFFPFTFLAVTVLIFYFMSHILPYIMKTVSLKNFLLYYGGISMAMFAIHGYLRNSYVMIGNSISKTLGAILFFLVITALSLPASKLYEWMVKKLSFAKKKK